MASGPPVIHFDIDLSELRGECLFTESLLLASLLTQPLGSPFTDLVHRCDAIRTEQQILTDAIIPRPLNEFKRPILGPELVTAETWPEKMKSGPPELAAFYDRTVAIIERSRKALADLQTLEIKLEQLPITGSVKKLVDDTNSTRAKAFGLLGELVHAHPELLLPNDWPGRFFRRTRRRTGTPASLETVMAQIVVLKTKMDALERLRIDLVGHEDVEKRAKADAERHDAETLLASKQKSLDVLQAEIEALKKKTE